MPVEFNADGAFLAGLRLPLPVLYGFLFVLARVAGVFTFFPLPGSRATPDLARLAFTIGATMALSPVWPRVAAPPLAAGALVAGILAEAAFGIVAGLIPLLLGEAFVFAAQLVAQQAGYSYASSIDPNSQADSGVLPVLALLISNLLFFAFGMDRLLLGALFASVERLPPGAFTVGPAAGEIITRMLAASLETAVRLALPVVAFLLLADLTLALLGKVNQQLQLLTVAFPLKMLLALFVFGLLAGSLPRVYERLAAQAAVSWTRLVP
ncbi:MAG: flagellar biosynthetic protein FliR [Bryobacter sp.]|jgi:flagellar biosynthetic protein FliR|nr:flagellar biosynthetic protein FliR [Bryobacter sp.]